ncbi:MAG: bifunctional riboflavin kinase/FAD synthetase [Paludibacteraceae bacterium]|nr:bifunctional riboflavin kinase/FAD synthetase [Paludibacteraceae bacterium]
MNSRTATIGFFDGVHLGHQDLLTKVLQQAGQGNALVVTFSQHPATCLQPDFSEHNFRLTTNSERKALLNSFAGSAEFVSFNFSSIQSLRAVEFVNLLKEQYGVGHLVLGYNSRFGSDMPELEEYEKITHQEGIGFSRIEPFCIDGVHVSSSRIRKALLAGDIEPANKMLGRPYVLTGTVEHGRGVGHELGFPTANLQVDANKLVPQSGVYVAQTTIDGKTYKVMLNIGSNPTFDLGNRLFVEAHVLDFYGDLYSRMLSLEILSFIRQERRFTSVNALQEQIKLDRLHVQDYQF